MTPILMMNGLPGLLGLLGPMSIEGRPRRCKPISGTRMGPSTKALHYMLFCFIHVGSQVLPSQPLSLGSG